ncbi:MAG: CRISPR system precrRNA processing endoribonuclease RAMP protein Cas6 [Methylovulum sp.]|jgi:hypothetical protein
MLPIPELPIARFIFEFSYEGSVQLPDFTGSTWRGALGQALKKTICVVRHTDCEACMLYANCAYPYLFETPLPIHAQKMRLYTKAPHPFVIKTLFQEQPAPQRLWLGLHLFGDSYRYLPYFIHALERAGNYGMGKYKQIFSLETVATLNEHQQSEIIYSTKNKRLSPIKPSLMVIPACPTQVRIHLQSPLRAKVNEACSVPKTFSFSVFFGQVLRRISMLSYFHTQHALDTDFAYLTNQAKTIALTDIDLNWQDWRRYSSRQQTAMNMGGLVGSFTLSGELHEFWPYLWLGQWTHVGKGTSMGLGIYTIESTSLPDLS